MQLLAGEVWGEITKLASAASHREVAVAFLGKDAQKQLPLGSGDVLVVNMSTHSLKLGLTNPYTIARYLAKGVKVFSVENLHAKVFVFDETVIIGSANASPNSKNNMVEAAIVTRSKQAGKQAREFIESLCLAPVTPQQAADAQKIFVPGKGHSNKKTQGKPSVGRLWVINCKPLKQDDSELDSQAAEVSEELEDKALYELSSISFSARTRFVSAAAAGDLVIEIHTDGSSITVYPPARLLHTREYSNENGTKKVGVHLERRIAEEEYYWSAFKRCAESAGIELSKNSLREVRNHDTRRALLEFFTE